MRDIPLLSRKHVAISHIAQPRSRQFSGGRGKEITAFKREICELGAELSNEASLED